MAACSCFFHQLGSQEPSGITSTSTANQTGFYMIPLDLLHEKTNGLGVATFVGTPSKHHQNVGGSPEVSPSEPASSCSQNRARRNLGRRDFCAPSTGSWDERSLLVKPCWILQVFFRRKLDSPKRYGQISNDLFFLSGKHIIYIYYIYTYIYIFTTIYTYETWIDGSSWKRHYPYNSTLR